jgi:C4-type Zn-finger protein
MKKLLKELEELRTGLKPFTLVMKDPLGHSFLQNPFYPN